MPNQGYVQSVRRWLAGLIVLVVVVGVVVLVAMETADPARGPEEPLVAADVLADADGFQGERVRMSDQVQDVRAPFFTIGGDDPDRQILVYPTPEGLDPTITENDALDVRGAVRRFDVESFEARFDRSFDAFAEWEGRVVLVADTVDPAVPDDGTAPA